MKHNPRVELPPPRPPGEERILEAKDVMYENVYRDYMKTNCNEKGNQKCTNLNKDQIQGKVKLQSQQKEGLIIVNCTDKSGRMSVSTRENYIQQGASIVAKDEKVGWKAIEEAKAEIANH